MTAERREFSAYCAVRAACTSRSDALSQAEIAGDIVDKRFQSNLKENSLKFSNKNDSLIFNELLSQGIKVTINDKTGKIRNNNKGTDLKDRKAYR